MAGVQSKTQKVPVENNKNLYELLSSYLAEKVEETKSDQRWKLEPIADLYRLAATAAARNKPIVWTSVVSKPEIFWAMDTVPIGIEHIDGILASMPGNPQHKYIDLAEDHLVADHVCSLNKTMIGMAISGDLPKPNAMVHVVQPCDSIRVTYSAVAQVLDVPAFNIDIPLWRNERAYRYIADELERMVSFLEETLGKKLEYEKLKQVMEYSNRAHEYNARINDLRRMRPSPLADNPSPPFAILGGTPECENIAKKIYEIGKERAERGEGLLTDEKIRFGWFSTGVGHDPGIRNWLQKEFGGIVVSEMGSVRPGPVKDLSSLRKIYEGLAEQTIKNPMTRECGGIAEDWINHAIPVCRDFKLDAVLMTLNFGCKSAWALAKLLKDEIADQVGIPSLVLEVDLLDGRIISGDSVRETISDFVTTMLAA